MRAVILDTNVYRGCGDARFKEMLDLEAKCGVYPVADPWTMHELVAGLADRTHRDYGSYRAAIRRLADRSLRGAGHVVMPAEAQAHMLLFGEKLLEHQDAIQFVADTALRAASIAEAEWGAELIGRIQAIAEAVDAQERWFADHFAALSQALRDAITADGGSVGVELRIHIRSESTLRADAEATVRRAFARSGRTAPEVLSEQLVDEVVTVFRAGFVATAVALERVCCDGANMTKSKSRNLIWDQEIAHNVGHTLGDFKVLVVSSDGIFVEAARRAGFAGAVVSPARYLASLRRASERHAVR